MIVLLVLLDCSLIIANNQWLISSFSINYPLITYWCCWSSMFCSQKTVHFSEQTLTTDKYLNIFPCQMEATVYISGYEYPFTNVMLHFYCKNCHAKHVVVTNIKPWLAACHLDTSVLTWKLCKAFFWKLKPTGLSFQVLGFGC